MSKLTDAQKRANYKYNKKAYISFTTRFKPEQKKVFDNHCEKFEYSKNGFMIKSVLEAIERETGKTFEDLLKESEQSKDQTN